MFLNQLTPKKHMIGQEQSREVMFSSVWFIFSDLQFGLCHKKLVVATVYPVPYKEFHESAIFGHCAWPSSLVNR